MILPAAGQAIRVIKEETFGRRMPAGTVRSQPGDGGPGAL
ncbi:hypothetical protein B2K_40535 [Paenibacillus mucilaginosus K02]|uniref:Uncharacterized protein n=1 Tax=Paenibacillus mucilaginosus K02 TaxID=997761 RepID=R9UM29_9BACL|nr:hypothetical protein B2K_40535 [Paenibacillus mucilaginosus K02]